MQKSVQCKSDDDISSEFKLFVLSASFHSFLALGCSGGVDTNVHNCSGAPRTETSCETRSQDQEDDEGSKQQGAPGTDKQGKHEHPH